MVLSTEHLPMPGATLKGRSFLSTGEFTREELSEILDLAVRYKTLGHGRPLQGKSVALLFFDPSLRTRASMEIAIHQLGGQAVVLDVGRGTWTLEYREGVVMDGDKSEHIKEAARVLSRYVAAIGVRSFPALRSFEEERCDPILRSFAREASVPIINLESAMFHPLQAMADVMTIREIFGLVDQRRVVLCWAYHPKPLPMAVPNAFALIAAQFGMDLTIACPPEYELDPELMQQIREQAHRNGASVRVLHDRHQACRGAEIIYAKSWGSRYYYGRWEEERPVREKYRDWIVDEDLMRLTGGGYFMHCLPIRRNVVATDAVLDSERSLVIQQAENRLHVQKALLSMLL